MRRKKQPSAIRRHWRSLVLGLMLSISSGALAAWAVLQFIRGFETQLAEAMHTDAPYTILVASVDMEPGHIVTFDDLQEVQLPPRFVPPSAFSAAAYPVGRTTHERVLAGDILREERLSEPGTAGGLEALVPMGMRAMSVNLSSEQAVSGFLQEGARVDILVTLPREADSPAITTTALSNVRVVAVDDRHELSQRRGVTLKPQITIIVTADDAQRVTQALKRGRVMAVLRSDLDLSHRPSKALTTADMLGHMEERRVIRFDQALERPILREVQMVAGPKTWTE